MEKIPKISPSIILRGKQSNGVNPRPGSPVQFQFAKKVCIKFYSLLLFPLRSSQVLPFSYIGISPFARGIFPRGQAARIFHFNFDIWKSGVVSDKLAEFWAKVNFLQRLCRIDRWKNFGRFSVIFLSGSVLFYFGTLSRKEIDDMFFHLIKSCLIVKYYIFHLKIVIWVDYDVNHDLNSLFFIKIYIS